MAPTVRSSSSAGGDNTTTATPTKPTGLAVGDYLLAFHVSDRDGTLAAMTAPSGFTALATSSPNTSTTIPACKIWGKVATSTDVAASSFAFPDSTGSHCSVDLLAITTGTYSTTTPVSTPSFATQGTASTTSITAPSITGANGALLLCGFMPDTGGTVRTFSTAPSGMTLVVQSTAGTSTYTRAGVYSQALASSAATGTKTAVLSGVPSGWAAASLLVNPSGATYDKDGGGVALGLGDGASAVAHPPASAYDLANFKLTLPTGSPNATEIDQPALTGYSDANFYLDGSARMAMVTPPTGATTTGSSATRTEAREKEAGAEAAWNMATTGNRFLTVTGVFDPTSITGGTGARQEMIIGQIHGSSGTPPLYLAVEFTSGTPGTPLGSPRLRIYKDGPGLSNPLTGLTSTTKITYRIEVAGGRTKLWVATGDVANLPANPQGDWASTDFTEDTTACYFKFGSYHKTTTSSGSTGNAIAYISYLQLLQTNGVVRLKDGGAITLATGGGAKTLTSATTYDKDGGGVALVVGDGAKSVTSATTYDKDGGAVVVSTGDGAKSLTSVTTYNKDGGGAVVGLGDGAKTLTPATTTDKGGGAVALAVGDGAKVLASGTTYDKGGGGVVLALGDGAKSLTSATTYDKVGGAVVLRVGDGAKAVTSATTYDKVGGGVVVGLGDGASSVAHPTTTDKVGGALVLRLGDGAKTVTSAITFDKVGGGVLLALGDGAKVLASGTTYDKGGGAVVVGLGDGAKSLSSPTIYDKGGGAVLLGVGTGDAIDSSGAVYDKGGGGVVVGLGDGASSVAHPTTTVKVGGGVVVGLGNGEWDYTSASTHLRDGGAVLLALGSGDASVSSAGFYDGDGGASVLVVGSGSVDVLPPGLHDRSGGGVALALGSGISSVSSPTTHVKGGGSVLLAVGDGIAQVSPAPPSTHDKTGGAAGLCIAAGTRVVVHGDSDTGGAFVTLLQDLKVRVGDTWSSPTWAILLPGGVGIDLAAGWDIRASVRQHRADGGEKIHSWVQPDGVSLGQAEVTLATGTTVTTSTIALRHNGADSEEWPIFVGRWDIEISRDTEDYTVAAGSFRTVREVTS